MGRLCLEAGMRDEALAEFRAVSQGPDADATNLTAAAWGLYMAGESREATALVERALALDPTYGNAYHLQGWLRLAAGDYTAAASSLETAFQKTPRSFGNPHQGNVDGDVAALYYAGVAYQKLGRKAEAAEAFRRLLERCRKPSEGGALSPDSQQWQAQNYVARADARLGLTAEEPPRLSEDDTTYFVQSARLHAVEGRKQQALAELKQGIELGHGELRHIRDDPDFESLRDDPAFQKLVAQGNPRP
jgi:tetratricopeptide (TPR) repeat protein